MTHGWSEQNDTGRRQPGATVQTGGKGTAIRKSMNAGQQATAGGRGGRQTGGADTEKLTGNARQVRQTAARWIRKQKQPYEGRKKVAPVDEHLAQCP